LGLSVEMSFREFHLSNLRCPQFSPLTPASGGMHQPMCTVHGAETPPLEHLPL